MGERKTLNRKDAKNAKEDEIMKNPEPGMYANRLSRKEYP